MTMDEEGPDVGAPGLEERLKRLEVILSRMEASDVTLEDALALFEEGVGHVRAAEAVLSETELKVEELLGSGATEAMEIEDS